MNEQVRPAFQQGAIHEEMKRAVIQQPELSEADKQTLELGQRVGDVIDNLKHPEASEYLKKGVDYHTDEETQTTLQVTVEQASHDRNAIIIKGAYKGPGGTGKRFGIYCINTSGEISAVIHDGSQKPRLETVDVSTEVGATRTQEASHMISAVVESSKSGVSSEKRKAAGAIEQLKFEREKLIMREMGHQPDDYIRLASLLEGATRTFGRTAKSGVEALQIRKRREKVTAELVPYGIDTSDTSQLEGLAVATQEIASTYTNLSERITAFEEKAEKARSADQGLSLIR